MIKITGMEMHGNSQILLNQRDIIGVVDSCPQILKEDRIFLRDRLKKFFQDPQNCDSDQNIKILLQIFAECKKPLKRLQSYEKHFHWLQVKLRKYITNERKKEKTQKIQQFILQSPNTKRYNEVENQDHHFEHSAQSSNLFSHLKNIEDNHSKINFEKISSHHKRCSQIEEIRDHQTSREKRSYQKWTAPPETKINSPKFLTSRNLFLQDVRQTSTSRKTKENVHKNSQKNFNPWKGKNSLSSNEKKLCKKPFRDQKIENTIIFKQNMKQKSEWSNLIGGKEKVNQIKYDHPFEEHDENEDQFYRSLSNKNEAEGNELELSTICRQKISSEDYQRQMSSFDQNHEQLSIEEGLFTSKQLLQECKKFIKTGKLQIQDCELSKEKERSAGLSIIQENISFQDNSSIEKTQKLSMKQFLQNIFKPALKPEISMTREEFQREKEKVEENQRLFLDKVVIRKLNQQVCLNFMEIYHQLRKEDEQLITFSLSNLFQLFDVSQKGRIEEEDFSNFLQNFKIPEIDPSISEALFSLIQRFKAIAFDTTPNPLRVILPGTIEFLELIENENLLELAEYLQQFQFEIYI